VQLELLVTPVSFVQQDQLLQDQYFLLGSLDLARMDTIVPLAQTESKLLVLQVHIEMRSSDLLLQTANNAFLAMNVLEQLLTFRLIFVMQATFAMPEQLCLLSLQINAL